MNELAYCPNLNETIERLRLLYEQRAMDRVFMIAETPSPALDDFAGRYPHDYCDYPTMEERVAFWDAHLSRKRDVHDDGVPCAYLSECDQGLYGGVVGGEVRYMAHPDNGWISSMVPPLLDSLEQLDGVVVDTQGEVFLRYRRQLDAFTQAAEGRFAISHFILIDALNFAFELVGATQSYLALIDEPERVRQVIDFAFDLNVMIQETFFERVPRVAGGTASNMVGWLPGRAVSESLDPYHMTSVEDFERWGREPAERILTHFDGGGIHIHANGRHLLPAASSLRGLRAIFLGDDLGFPSAFDVLPEIRDQVGEMPLVTQCEYGRFEMALTDHTLTGGVLYRVQDVPNSDAANRLMEQVRDYRA